MEKTDYPERIYASKYPFRNGDDPYGDYYLKNEKGLCVEYVRADLVPQWHSVKDQLPTITDGESANVLAVDEYGDQGVAWLRQYTNGATDWWSCDERLEKHAITAWREIEPYRAKEEKP